MVTCIPGGLCQHVGQSARYWERLGFACFFAWPAGGEPGYLSLRQGGSEAFVLFNVAHQRDLDICAGAEQEAVFCEGDAVAVLQGGESALLANTMRDPSVLSRAAQRLNRWIETL
jgi:hypothetical protein